MRILQRINMTSYDFHQIEFKDPGTLKSPIWGPQIRCVALHILKVVSLLIHVLFSTFLHTNMCYSRSIKLGEKYDGNCIKLN